MRTLEQWFSEYAVSHQNKTNKAIHYVCVPAIYFAVLGILMSVKISIIGNLAVFVLVIILYFYARISVNMTIKMGVFSIICLAVNLLLSRFVNLFYFSLLVFAIAWIGQFYGHKIEGKKPSFLKDLQFLMIGPAWVIENLFAKK